MFGGMIVSTVLNLIFVPVLYVAVSMLRKRTGNRREYGPLHPAPANGAKKHVESGVAANYIYEKEEE